VTIRRSATAGDRVAVLQRAALQDQRLSFLALGVLCAVLSRPPGWRTSVERLAKERREGRDAIRRALQELQAGGYLERQRSHDDHGHWTWEWNLSDQPVSAGQTIGGNPSDGDPPDGDPDVIEGVEVLGVEDPPLPPAVTSPPGPEPQGGADQSPDTPDQPPDSAAHPPHEHDQRTRRTITRTLHAGHLPADLNQPILDTCYRVGRGDPWRGWVDGGIREHVTENLDGSRNIPAVIKARLRDTPTLSPAEAITTPCPDHPDHPAGRCDTCQRQAVRPPPGSLRRAVKAARDRADAAA
jgi:hypothetical protein